MVAGRGVAIDPWPSSDEELLDVQRTLAQAAEAALHADPWELTSAGGFLVGGCFIAYATGQAGPGRPGDRAWAAAVVWEANRTEVGGRAVDRHLRGSPRAAAPRRADDVVAQAVVTGRVPAAYRPGLLALREGPLLAAAMAALDPGPDVLLVDASGIDHPRGAGLALHLGAVAGVPTVGVTQRPLVSDGGWPAELRRGASSPVTHEGRRTGSWVCTRTGTRPILAHAAWRTAAQTAAEVVLASSTEAARTPVPLQEARRVAREARSLAEAGYR